jgi:hypothetical protein
MARKYEYTKVETLPEGAVSVREFCNQQNWPNVQNFYNKIAEGKLPDVEIVVYCGLNFVTPVKKN